MNPSNCVLIVLDGWGIGVEDSSNPIYIRQPKNINYIKSHFPLGSLQTSGIAIGLPWGEEGNSEVGHLTLGAGKTIYQHYPRITMAIQQNKFNNNPALNEAVTHCLKTKTALHLIGLLGGGIVHSSIDHLIALIRFAKEKGVINLNLHLFADGKDSSPRSVEEYLDKIQKKLDEIKVGRIATLTGRYYAMDRDERWELIERTYNVLCGKSTLNNNAKSVVFETYQKGFNDEFIEPTLINPEGAIQKGDSLIFFDYREDSIKEIAEAFTDPNFNKFSRARLENLFVTTFTDYGSKIKSSIAFPADKAIDTLGKVLEENEIIQLRVAESEKYPHATYFFNGLIEKPYKNEYRVILPSQKGAHSDEHPEMMAKEIAERVIQGIEGRGFNFIFANFANPDVIAHSGNYEAALKAIDIIDEQIGLIMKASMANDFTLIITSDHGNIERMIDSLTSRIQTKHDANPVPIYLIHKKYLRKNTPETIKNRESESIGTLADVAPTILEIMNVKKPVSMTGQSLLKDLCLPA